MADAQTLSPSTVDAFVAAPEDRQREALGKMSVPAKTALLTALKSRKTQLTPSSENLTENTNHEGLYEMKGPDGAVHVPFGKVKDAQGGGYSFGNPDTETRYHSDLDASKPSWFQSATEPTSPELNPNTKPQDKSWSANRDAAWNAAVNALSLGESAAGNILKRAARTVSGAAQLPFHVIGIVSDLSSKDEETSQRAEDELLALHPGAQIADRVKEAIDEWRKSPSLATENVLGDALGTYLTGKATEGVSKAVEAAPRAANTMAKELVGIRPKTAAEMVTKTVEKNAEAAANAGKANAANAQQHLEKTQEAIHKTQGAELEHEAAVRASKAKAEETNAEAARQHLEKTQEAIHETTGKELEHQAKVKAENDKAQAEHAEEVAAVKEHNDRVTAKHETDTTERQEHNKALENTLELRRQRTEELEKATNEYYAKEDEIKAKAKAEENDAWQPWHEKMEDVTVDGGRIAKALEKVTAVSPDAARALRQLIPDPGDAAPNSLYAQDRLAIMKSQGIDSNYEDLPAEKRALIDRIAASSGFEPDPIDFDPQAGRELPVEQIHRAQSILGKYIRSNRYEGHVLGEMHQVQNALRAELNRVSMEHGAFGDLERARKATQKYQQAFGRERPSPQTIDELRKKGANPEQFKEEEEQERLDAAAKHSQELVDAHEHVKTLREELRSMPSEDTLRKKMKQLRKPPSVGDIRPSYRLKPAPKPPTLAAVESPARVAPPDRPAEVAPEEVKPPVREAPPDRPPEVKPEVTQVGEEDITEANRKQYAKTIENLRNRGIWYGAALPWLWVARDLIALNFGKAAMNAVGAGMSSMLTVAGLTKLADVLERPEIRDWVATPSPAEMRELEKLPPEQRKAVAEGFRKINIVAQKKGYRVSPLIAAYMAANKGMAKVPNQDEEQK